MQICGKRLGTCLKKLQTDKKHIYRTISIVAGTILLITFAVSAFYGWFLPKKFSFYVAKYALEYGVESELIYAVIKSESGFDEQAVSRSGAIGLMQLMPQTADYMAKLFKIKEPDLLDPETNIRIGILYLRYLQNRYNTLTEVLAAYNAGEGRVRNWLCDPNYSKDGEHLFYIPFAETNRYVKRVKKFCNYYKFFYI